MIRLRTVAALCCLSLACGSDPAPPPAATVSNTDPVSGRLGVGTAALVHLTFSKAMQSSTLKVQAADGPCSGSVQLFRDDSPASCLGGTLASTDARTFTFTPAAPFADDTRYALRIDTTPVAQDGGLFHGYTMPVAFMTTRFPEGAKEIYATPHDGKLGGAAGADAVCSSAAVLPPGVASGKAILTDATRTACTVANCGSGNVQTNWALAPNTHYVGLQGQLVFTTNAQGIFTGWPLDSVVGTGLNFWDALNPDWTSRTGNNCADWTRDGSSDSGDVGWDNESDSAWLTGGALGCDQAYPQLLCAEQ